MTAAAWRQCPAKPALYAGDEGLRARLLSALQSLEQPAAPPAAVPAAAWLSALARQQLDVLPRPAAGATLQRWQALADVATHDLSLAKLYEGHTDALSILDELGGDDAPRGNGVLWGTWAAEAPGGRTIIESGGSSQVALHGRKCWCSGAAELSHGLLTAWHADGRGPQLVWLEIAQPGAAVAAGAWQSLGMAASASLDIDFRGARARLVGTVGQYLSRPGFWQGGAGIAACWYGGALALARALRSSLLSAPESGRSAFRYAALGRVDGALKGTAALLREAAHWIDDHPHEAARAVALRARLAAEDTAARVLHEVGRALGATPFCRDARFARAAADLPVFVRQSHAERDLAALGEEVLALDGHAEGDPWRL
jgi:hypothetical protein